MQLQYTDTTIDFFALFTDFFSLNTRFAQEEQLPTQKFSLQHSLFSVVISPAQLAERMWLCLKTSDGKYRPNSLSIKFQHFIDIIDNYRYFDSSLRLRREKQLG